jgi:hypothetical protein
MSFGIFIAIFLVYKWWTSFGQITAYINVCLTQVSRKWIYAYVPNLLTTMLTHALGKFTCPTPSKNWVKKGDN